MKKTRSIVDEEKETTSGKKRGSGVSEMADTFQRGDLSHARKKESRPSYRSARRPHHKVMGHGPIVAHVQ